MPDPQKLQSKISASAAQTEAERILSQLVSHRDGTELTTELCSRFTLGPRNEILGAWVKLTRQPQTALDPEQARQFILAMMNSIKGPNTAEYFASTLTAAIALSDLVGEQFIVSLMEHILMAENSEGRSLVPSPSLPSISRSVPRMGSILTRVLTGRQSRSPLERGFLKRWVDCLLPLLGLRTWGLALDPEDAATILEILAATSAAILPDEALLICPRLIAIAGAGRTQRLNQSDLFQSLHWIRELPDHGSPSPPAPGDTGVVPESAWDGTPKSGCNLNSATPDEPNPVVGQEKSTLPTDEDAAEAEFLRAAQIFVCAQRSRLHELEERLRESTNDLGAARERLSQTLEQSDRLQRLHDAELERIKIDFDKLKAIEASIRSENASHIEERDRWQREVQLQEKEQAERIRNQLDNRNKQISDSVSGATRNLRDHVLSAIRSRPDDRKLRLLALAFDTLHKRVLRLIGEPDSERLPEEFRTINNSVTQDNAD
jgi:hypothetical protein